VAKYPYPFKQANFYPFPWELRISAKYLPADTYLRIPGSQDRVIDRHWVTCSSRAAVVTAAARCPLRRRI